jgi:KDEL-tailed cysteine endopeptidase
MIPEGRRNLALVPVKRRGGDGNLTLPVSVDWRNRTCQGQPCLGPVRNQWFCGSCWAFAATAAIESHLAIRGDHDSAAFAAGAS